MNNEDSQQEELLTVQEVAKRFHCSSRQVIRLIDAGRLQAIDLGIGTRRKLAVSVEALMDFKRNSQVKTRKKLRPKPRGIPQFVTEAKLERARQQLPTCRPR